MSSEGQEAHVIVDGQQRIRAFLEFLSNQFPLGDESGELDGLRFEQLSPSDRQRIYEYKFVVRVLPELSIEKIRGIFNRLNVNNVALNKQEMRHATYWGEFISCVEELGKNRPWVNSGIFSSNDFRRIIDVEYVSELAVGVLFGPQNKKASLDTYYASFEGEFPDRQRIEEIFSAVVGELEHLIVWPNMLRWSRKIDFYSLFWCWPEGYPNCRLTEVSVRLFQGDLQISPPL